MEYSLIRWSLLLFSATLFGHGENPTVVAGEAVIEHPDPHTQIIRAQDKTAINFKKFSIAKDETTRFIQPHRHATVLCRVTGGEPSLIEGKLEANGRLLLINPSSIVFRETAQVRAASLVASTLDLKDEDFVRGKSRFFLSPDAQSSAIINQGNISVDHHLVLMAPQIVNTGVILAQAEKINFLGGELITLDFEGDHLISFAIEEPLKAGLIHQEGQLSAPQGEVCLRLKVADELMRSVLNVNGVVQACAIHQENGVIHLVAGSEISGEKIQIEAPVIINEGSYKAKTEIDLSGHQRLDWRGGKLEALKKGGRYDVSLSASFGTLTIDEALSGPFNRLMLKANIIDQNQSVNSGRSLVVYDAPQLFLGASVSNIGRDMTFTGDVIVDGIEGVKITSSHKTLTFAGRVDADQPHRILEVKNGGKGVIEFQREIGVKGPLGELKIGTNQGTVVMSKIGDRSRPGVGHLMIEDSTVNLAETSWILAHHQNWSGCTLSAHNATFLATHEPLTFAANCKLHLQEKGRASFETQGGAIELPPIVGDHHQPITVHAGRGNVQTNEIKGDLGDLKIQGREILLGGKIEASSIFMEADHHIRYFKSAEGAANQTGIVSQGDVTINAKHGMIGLDEMPIHVETQGRLFVGAKSMAYLDGSSSDGYPHIYPKNPPPRLIFRGHEVQYAAMEEIFAEEEQLISLTPDLFHAIPRGFIQELMLTPRKAPIYAQKD